MEKTPGCRGINMQAYADQIMRPHLGPLFSKAQENDPCVFVIEDNAPVHGKKGGTSLCNKIRMDLDIYSIDWPPSSPDMNVIENI